MRARLATSLPPACPTADNKKNSMADKTVSADSGSTFKTLRNLWPYMWPADRADLKARVVWATFYLVVAKLVLIGVPYFFKWATDALADDGAPLPPLPDILLAPVMLVVAYNVVRLVQLGFNQLRDAMFARVGQHAVRQLAYKTFVHMHELSLRFHLERRTGGLSRIIERGVKGIETIVRFTILNTAPTVPMIGKPSVPENSAVMPRMPVILRRASRNSAGSVLPPTAPPSRSDFHRLRPISHVMPRLYCRNISSTLAVPLCIKRARLALL